MSAGVIPPPFDTDRLLLAERADWERARIARTERAVLLVRPSAQGDILFARGEEHDVLDLLDAEGRLRHRAGAEPALWLSAPRTVAVPAWVLDALRLAPFSQWDWMSIATAPAAPATGEGVLVRELDRVGEADVVLDVLRRANPRSTADPRAEAEVAWWGAFRHEELLGAFGARREQGASDDGFSWHLHGLAVLEEARGAGVGAALTAALTREALARGADWVSLGLYAENDAARRLYRRLGFELLAAMSSYGPVTATRPLK